ncbi:uncharacterized protein Dvar_45660 [Desulfosarcina variabilis str. Montpellier]|uniref:hypothetical protein n=1 Tax=Desulfosarcina variabilis TaxID=2300 RepID=UPI003AFA488A
MMLSPTMKNVLDAIKDQTIKQRGKNAGQVKNRISGDAYYYNTICALFRRGLIDFKINTIHGNGWAATRKVLEY